MLKGLKQKFSKFFSPSARVNIKRRKSSLDSLFGYKDYVDDSDTLKESCCSESMVGKRRCSNCSSGCRSETSLSSAQDTARTKSIFSMLGIRRNSGSINGMRRNSELQKKGNAKSVAESQETLFMTLVPPSPEKSPIYSPYPKLDMGLFTPLPNSELKNPSAIYPPLTLTRSQTMPVGETIMEANEKSSSSTSSSGLPPIKTNLPLYFERPTSVTPRVITKGRFTITREQSSHYYAQSPKKREKSRFTPISVPDGCTTPIAPTSVPTIPICTSPSILF